MPELRRIVPHAGAVVLTACVLATALVDAPSGNPFALSLSKGERASWVPSALAGDGWSAEFEAVCSKTQDAMTLSNEELRALIRRCDALKPALDALDASRRKVFGKRLQLCRDLYEYVLESREGG